MVETLEELAYNEVCDALRRQEAKVESLRTRATALVSVGAVVFGLVGGKPSSNSDAWQWAALASFLVLGVAMVWILRPTEFRFVLDTDPLIHKANDAREAGVQPDLIQSLRNAAIHMQGRYWVNAGKIDRRMTAYEVGLGLLVLEVLFLGAHLAA